MTVLITGASGGIGHCLCTAFLQSGWTVLATDHPGARCPIPSRIDSSSPGFIWLPLDLVAFARDPEVRTRFGQDVRRHLTPASNEVPGHGSPPATSPLHCLINNAAVQRLGTTAGVTPDDWQLTLDVNLSAPFWLVRTFLPELEVASGGVMNIASIHARQTKPGFVSYATSKAALDGLTRALAVDLGGRVRVNAIAPAAISTPMLEAGFEGREGARRQLDAFHPVGRVGTPEEVARLALFLADPTLGHFLTGTTIGLDGAISARLHDPA